MRLEQLRLQGLGPFQEEHTFFFDAGCTLVLGANETGKTSIAMAVFGALYGLPDKALLCEGDESAWVEITFTAGGRSFTLYRDFKDQTVTLTETSNRDEEILFQGSVKDPDEKEVYRTRLALILGVGEGKVWARSGFVGNGELETEIDESVQAWLIGNPQGGHRTVFTRLRTRLNRIEGSDESGNAGKGELGRVRAELEKKQADLEAWPEAATGIYESWKALYHKEKELSQARKKALENEDYLMNLVRFDHLSKEKTRLENQLIDLRDERDRIRTSIEDQEQARSRLEEEYSAFLNHPGDPEEAIQTWVDLVNRRQSLDRDLARMEKGAPAPSDYSRGGRNSILISTGLGGVAWLACYGAGAAQLGFFLFPLFALLGFLISWNAGRNTARLFQDREEERLQLEKERDEVRKNLAEIKRSLGNLGDYESPAALRRKFRGFLDMQDKLDRSRNLSSGHRPLSEVMDAYEQVFSELQVLDTETRDLVVRARYLSGMDAKPEILAKKMDDARSEGEEASSRAAVLAEEIKEIKEISGDVSDRITEPGRVAEDIFRLQARYDRLSREAKRIRVAINALRNAVESYQEGHLDRVTRRASAHLQDLVLERYGALRLDSELRTEIQNGDAWIGMSDLSRVTRDQVWFALRLAIHEEAGDRSLPLVLDEPFVGWDDARLDQAREILQKLSKSGFQAVILSSDSRVSSWDKNVLQLSESRNGSGERKVA